MTDRLRFDDRLWNPYAVEELERSHPVVFGCLQEWFRAIGAFDDESLGKLAASRGPTEVERHRASGEAALAEAAKVAVVLRPVIVALIAALEPPGAFPERAELETLLAAAHQNLSALTEDAPRMVAQALASATGYDDVRAAAIASMREAVARAEAIAASVGDGRRQYADLQPNIAQLRDAAKAFNAAVEPLNREDQRALRKEHQRGLAAASSAACRALFAAKMRDQAQGVWPRPAIAAPGASAAERFAAAIAGGEFDGAAQSLAPWLRGTWSAEALRATLDAAARDIVKEFRLPSAPRPGGWTVSRSPWSYADARASEHLPHPLPAEVTGKNFDSWCTIDIVTEEEDEYLTDVGYLVRLQAAVVRTPDGDRVGHLHLLSA